MAQELDDPVVAELGNDGYWFVYVRGHSIPFSSMSKNRAMSEHWVRGMAGTAINRLERAMVTLCRN